MRKTVKRATLVLALTPLMSLPATAAFAATGVPTPTTVTNTVTSTTHSVTSTTTPKTTTSVTTPAPGASASAVAAKVNGIITVGGTSTSANSSGGSASADALDLLGTRIAGGDATDPAKPAKGSLFATPANPIGDFELAPWAASVQHSGDTSSADAEAALAHAGLLGLLQVWVLHSHSHSDYTPEHSQGSSSSDGAEVQGPSGLDIKVLHAETSSGHDGKSDLLVINGTEIGSSGQAAGACSLDLDPVLTLLCLEASGGNGTNGVTNSSADVATVTGVLPGVTVVGAGSTGGTVQSTPATKPGGGTKPVNKPAKKPTAAHDRTPAAGKGLPFTGLEAGLLSLYGAALAGLGGAITLAGRRRRTAVTAN